MVRVFAELLAEPCRGKKLEHFGFNLLQKHYHDDTCPGKEPISKGMFDYTLLQLSDV